MLDQADKEWIAARYVHKDDCVDTQEQNAKKFANDDTRIKLFEQQLSMWSKLFWVIASATVGQLVVSLLELV